MAFRFQRTILTTLALAFGSGLAEAHPHVGGAVGFLHGFSHPLGGLDHIAAMVAVGVLAARLGGKALWLVPASFVTMMAIGGAFGVAAVQLPLTEFAIAASVLVLGAMALLRIAMPVSLAAGLAGFFAIFHGHAHGAEMPVVASGLSYGLGFVLASVVLHATGIGIGYCLGLGKRKSNAIESEVQR